MATEVIMPKMGEIMEEGRLIRWYKNEGDTVERGEPIFQIETDKSVVEIESRVSGILLKIVHHEGEVVPIGQIVAYIGKEGEKLEDDIIVNEEVIVEKDLLKSAESKEEQKKSKIISNTILATPYAKKLASEKGIKLEDVNGTGDFGAIISADIMKFKDLNVTPLAKKIAEDINVDLSKVQGSGYKGKIFKDDVYFEQKAKITNDVQIQNRVMLTGMKKVIADRMYTSHSEIPHITLCSKADITELLKLRENINNKQEQRISINDFIIKAVCFILKELPYVNSSLEENEIVYKKDINVGIAVAVKEGLIVPVIKNADCLSLKQISIKSKELIDKAREGKLIPDDYKDGTFTVSNLGMYGITCFTSIINQPEAAILGVCAIEDQLVMIDDKVENRKIIGLCFNFDHRIMSGADGAVFLKRLKGYIENPLEIII